MTTHANLIYDGYESVADHIKRCIKKQGGLNTVAVKERGQVAIYRASKPLDPTVYEEIGTYTPSVPVEHIEDDLLTYLRERFPHRA